MESKYNTIRHCNVTALRLDFQNLTLFVLENLPIWVNNMTEPAEDEPLEIQSRPARQVYIFIYFGLKGV